MMDQGLELHTLTIVKQETKLCNHLMRMQNLPHVNYILSRMRESQLQSFVVHSYVLLRGLLLCFPLKMRLLARWQRVESSIVLGCVSLLWPEADERTKYA